MAYARQLKNERWQGAYRGPDKKKKYIGPFRTKRLALDAAQEEELKIRQGEWIDPSAGQTTIRELSEKWLKVQSASEKSMANNRAVLDAYVLPRWGDVAVNEISYLDVKEWIVNLTGQRDQPLASATKRKVLWVLSNMLGLAVEGGMVRTNAAHDSRGRPPRLPKGSQEREQIYLSYRQLRRLASVTREPYDTLVLLMGTTGLRPGEALALRVGDFDMLRRRVQVKRAYTSVDGRLVLKDPKTHEKRSVAFPKALVSMLARVMEGKGRDDLVFPAPEGGPLEQSNLASRVVAPAVRLAATAVERVQEALDVTPVDGVLGERTEAAVRRFQKEHGLAVDGIVSEPVWEALRAVQRLASKAQLMHASKLLTLQLGDEDFNPTLTPYALRHTAASLAIDSGANVLVVSKMLGHAQPTLTLNTYSHLFSDRLDDIADRMNEMFVDGSSDASSRLAEAASASRVPHDLGLSHE